MLDVEKTAAKWRGIKANDRSMDAQRGEEPRGGIERKGAIELLEGDVKGSSKGVAKKPRGSKKEG